jgi:hypothetical protein
MQWHANQDLRFDLRAQPRGSIPHLHYDASRKTIISYHDYGQFQFTIQDSKITCIIFITNHSGERIWINPENEGVYEESPTFNSINLNNPTIELIPKIIEKWEIKKLFQ